MANRLASTRPGVGTRAPKPSSSNTTVAQRRYWICHERYEQLMAALEDAENVVAFNAAMAEEGPNHPLR